MCVCVCVSVALILFLKYVVFIRRNIHNKCYCTAFHGLYWSLPPLHSPLCSGFHVPWVWNESQILREIYCPSVEVDEPFHSVSSITIYWTHLISFFRTFQFYLLPYELKNVLKHPLLVPELYSHFFCEFSDPGSCLTNDNVLLGYGAVSFCNWIPTFRENVVSSSQQPKHPRHGVVSQKN